MKKCTQKTFFCILAIIIIAFGFTACEFIFNFGNEKTEPEPEPEPEPILEPEPVGDPFKGTWVGENTKYSKVIKLVAANGVFDQYDNGTHSYEGTYSYEGWSVTIIWAVRHDGNVWVSDSWEETVTISNKSFETEGLFAGDDIVTFTLEE